MNSAPAVRLERKLSQLDIWVGCWRTSQASQLFGWEKQRALNGKWKSWMFTHTHRDTHTRVHTHRLASTVPWEERGMDWNEASCCKQCTICCSGADPLFPPKGVTRGSGPWAFEEGEGKNHCQEFAVTEALAEIWLIHHGEQKPPSGTMAAFSSVSTSQEKGSICSRREDCAWEHLGRKIALRCIIK